MELDLAGTGFLLTDPRLDDHPIVYVNEPFLEMTGYSADEVLGRNCRFLQGEDTDEAAIDELRSAIADERPVTVELVNYRKDGTPFWNQVHISPVRDGDGRLVHFVGVQVDVTASAGRRGWRERRSTLPRRRRPAAGRLARSRVHARLADAAVGPVPGRRLHRRRDPSRRGAPPGRARGGRTNARGCRPRPRRRPARARGAQRTARRSSRPTCWFDRPATAMIVPLKARGTIRRRGRVRVAVARARVRHAGPAAGRGPRAARRARDRQRAPVREPRHRSRARSSRGSSRSGCRRSRAWTSPRATGPAGDGSLIGGDFYDVLPREDGLDLVIGDVTGKGARAAALTAQVRHTLRTAAQYEDSPSRRAGRRQPHAAGRARRRRRALLHGRAVPGGAQRLRARDDLLRRAPDAVRDAPRRRGRAVGKPGSVLGWVPDPKLLDVTFELGDLRVARALHRRRDRGAHDRRPVRARRPCRAAARGGPGGRGGDRRAGGPRRGARWGAPRRRGGSRG